jgi:hypothetical protein
MNNEKWEELVELVQSTCKHVDVDTRESEESGHKIIEDVLDFENDKGHFRFIRTTKPLVLDKKQFYSHRPGDTARTEYKLSDTEVTYKMDMFEENDMGDWVELRPENFSF